MLYGRATEAAELELLLARAGEGRSGVLVIEGPAGSGKTALLDLAARRAPRATVLACAGAESEAELPFSALRRLLGRHAHRLAALPAPQAAALRAAFGFSGVPPADRLLVGLATLTLLSDLAAGGPVLCLVDDAQWLDRASTEALLFVGRRLTAEGIVLLVAQRDDDTSRAWDVRQMGAVRRLAALDRVAAAALLADRAGHLDPVARRRVIDEADGNPLALVELAATERPDGAPHRPVTAPGHAPGHRVADEFATRLDRLPTATRTALLVAATDSTGELTVVLTAAARLGSGPADFEPAERSRLLRFEGTRVAFRHPLIRSVLLRRASVDARSRAHRALADTLTGGGYADQRAWHLAGAATGFDGEAAVALEAAAARAELRGGFAAAAAAHERAARLTQPADLRARRLAAAATAARDSGQLTLAATLAAEALPLTGDPTHRSRLGWVRGRLAFELETPRRGYETLVAAARQAPPEEAARMLIEAVRMACFADAPVTIADAVPALARLPLPSANPLRPLLAASASLAGLLSGADPADVAPLAVPMRRVSLAELPPPIGGLHGHAASLALLAGRGEEALAEVDRLLTSVRDRGMVGGLPHLLLIGAEASLAAGELPAALAAATEGLEVAEETGQGQSAHHLRGVLARVAALTGDERRCVRLADEVARYGLEHGGTITVTLAALALCQLDLGLGRYASALDRFAGADPRATRHPTLALLAAPEWIEAAALSGRPAAVDGVLPWYEAWLGRHHDGPAARAVTHRCRALLAPDGTAEDDFQQALALHRKAGVPLERARTELRYGQWLRRNRRPVDARSSLAAALNTFTEAGARAFAEQARAELRAAGEPVPEGRPRDLAGLLTPQELHITRLAAAGLSNRDIGARLFLSPRTVGYHLYKAYPKLGVSSRAELAGLDLG